VLSPSTKNTKPQDLPASIWLDAERNVHRFLGCPPSSDVEECTVQKHGVVHLIQGILTPGLDLLLHELGEAGEALG